jgi:hypothetical protein
MRRQTLRDVLLLILLSAALGVYFTLGAAI